MEKPILNIPQNLEKYFKEDVFQIIKNINGTETPNWGIMTIHHAIEHLVLPLNFVIGTLKLPIMSPPERLEKLKIFLMSDNGLQQNVKQPFLPQNTVSPLVTNNLEEAKQFLYTNIHSFNTIINDTNFTTMIHPIFGNLNKQEWLVFQYKHFTHHFMQFSIV